MEVCSWLFTVLDVKEIYIKNDAEKYAILSMDVEEWYHLDYFKDCSLDKKISMLDGFTNYVDQLNKHNIKTTFFVVSELAEFAREQLLYASSCGHEIACHGKTHTRPLTMDPKAFEAEIREAKQTLEDLIGKEVIGYRAPCYSIDNERYDIIRGLGFKYSSSWMDIPNHPLYGKLDLSDYKEVKQGFFEKDGFVEFSLSTKKFLGKHLAVSGGGWIRLFPWWFMKPLISAYLKDAETYTLYIHPFELSDRDMPKVKEAGAFTHIRSHRGLHKVAPKVDTLIDMLENNGFELMTFGEAWSRINNGIEGL